MQLKDAATAVLAREKATSLAELVSVKLKFTIDAVNIWVFFLELTDVKRKDFIKKNRLLPDTTCCICGFLVDIDATGEKNGQILWLSVNIYF